LPESVAIIGAGPLGRWLALAAARAGFSVLLEDVMPANLHHAQEYLRQQLSPGTDPAESGEALQAIVFVSTIEDAVREADLVIDCVPDELESKLEILWLLDRMAPPRTVLATPTTHLSIAEAGTSTEILLRTTSRTAPETIALVRSFWERVGFTPRFEQDAAEQTEKLRAN
jgi:3-hydroxybutyryl-CoA dehydrogenase